MIDPAVLAAVAVVVGGIVAVAPRDGRIVILGLMLAAVAASIVASPLPSSLAVTARILGALLAAYLLWAAAGSGWVSSAGSAIGPVAEGAAAVAAFVVGLTIRPVDPLPGPIVAQAAGLALIALAVVPLAGRDVFRLGVGVTLLTLGCSLMITAWAGPTPPLEQLAMAALLIGIAGATSVLVPQPELATETGEPVESVDTGEPVESVESVESFEPVEAGEAPPQIPAQRAPDKAVATEPRPSDARAPTRTIASAEREEPYEWFVPTPTQPVGRRPRAGTVHRVATPKPADAGKPAPKKPTRSRPDLGGKP